MVSLSTGEGMKNAVFIDWLSASQLHEGGGIPVISGGLLVHYDEQGLPRFERNCATSLVGSHDTSIRISSDGFRVSVSGNVGRFSREDNLFNFGWRGTVERVNRILLGAGLPPFTDSITLPTGRKVQGAVVSRLDITCNYETGSESQARALIRWLGARSVSRMKRGMAGDESVWWSNSRRMLKAYIKHLEMLKHGKSNDEFVVNWCKQKGVVRVEVELKKRELSDLGMNHWEDITQEKIERLFLDETSLFRSVDRSDEPDLLAAIPARSRSYAAAWMAGQDLRIICSRATLFRHAKVLREYGLDILEPRNLHQFPVKVRVVDMVPLEIPDWYELEKVA